VTLRFRTKVCGTKKKYPIGNPNTRSINGIEGSSVEDQNEWLDKAREAFRSKNFVHLPDILPKAAFDLLLDEINSIPQSCHYRSPSVHNILLADDIDPEHRSVEGDNTSEAEKRAKEIVTRLKQESRKSLIAYDQFGEKSILCRFYNSEELIRFVSFLVLDRKADEKIFRSGDEIGGAYVNIFHEADSLGWHFDRSRFFVNLILQNPAGGGEFEYTWKENGCGSSPTFAELEKVLTDKESENESFVRKVPMKPGSLIIFCGSKAMHRVTPVTSNTPRINAIFTFEFEPDVVLNDYTRETFFGR